MIDAIHACPELDIKFPIDDIEALKEMELEFAKQHEVTARRRTRLSLLLVHPRPLPLPASTPPSHHTSPPPNPLDPFSTTAITFSPP